VDPPCGARFTSPALDLALVAGGCGRRWMDWGKPLADSGGHGIDNVAGIVDIEVYPLPPCPTYLG
jgi:hypothetical protein